MSTAWEILVGELVEEHWLVLPSWSGGITEFVRRSVLFVCLLFLILNAPLQETVLYNKILSLEILHQEARGEQAEGIVVY